MMPEISKTMPVLDPFFYIGEDVMIVAGRREGLSGIVIKVTTLQVVIVDNAGFCHWFSCSDVIHTFGPYW